jgi:FtsH-binding integral membrane protein
MIENKFMRKVYGWMSLGLLVTALVSFVVVSNESLIRLFLGNTWVFYGLLILEVLAVIFLSSAIRSLSVNIAKITFILYSILNGLTLSVIFLVYTGSSIATVFIITAGMFALISVYGYTTKKDLTSVGSFAFMALVGLILASLVNLFFHNDKFTLILSYIGVVVFVALTAYDSQKIKAIGASVPAGSDDEKKVVIVGALNLYLDFINLFLDLLRIMGGRRK